ncbi:mRNA binding protein [Echinococcus multilocularis]|uniref:mRNA binding protein n=1 Tax=Echinococcus multilocularis TaxID=6211 RepID=A0A087VY13_ECHMU|nr:mRNA binding protein [Echinococcus multilocularis]
MTSAVHDYTYSVQVKSRFDLFAKDDYNGEDPDVLLTRLRTQKRERKSSAKEASEKASQDVFEPIQKEAQATRNDRRGADQKASLRDASGNVRGRAAPRGRGVSARNKAPKFGGQRVFDRHSGSDKTGVKAVMKKDGHGTGNWGTLEDELEAQMAEVVPEPTTEEEAPAEEVKPAESTPTEQIQEPVDERPKTLTLKEYREQLRASKAKVQLTTKGERRPNDGKNVFSDMVEVHKSKPLEPKVELVLEDKPQIEEEAKTVVFEFGRGRPTPRGRAGRPFGSSEFRGRGSGPRADRQSREELQAQPAEQTEQQSQESPDSTEPSGQPSERSTPRGGRRGERVFRGGSRGRGFIPRVGFNAERGRGRGGGPGGDRSSFRGGDRPVSYGGDRPSFRGGERGGRGMRGGGPRGGGVGANVGGGGFRRGRGAFDGPQEGRGGTRGGLRAPTNTAPSMDSDADFPALK